jgi:hypothetical protein
MSVRSLALRQPRTRTGLTAWAGIAASAAAVVLLAVPGRGPNLAGAFLLACVPVGAAVMCWVDSGEGLVQAGLTLVLSLAVTAIVSAAMIWLTAWHPPALYAFAVIGVTSCAGRLVCGGASVLRGAPVRRGAPIRGALVLQPGLLLVGIGAWAFGVSQTQRQAIGPYGVLASANGWFFVGLAVLLAGMLAELSRTRPRTWLLGAFLIALIAAIHTTVPLLYGGTPEYAWVYKHVGVAQAFGQYHRVTATSNIYQEWPALFTTVASISALGNAGPLSFAAWGPVAFELADALLLLGIFRLLTGDRRLPYLAVLLYEGLIAWVGQDYLSPQAFGYLLWLGIMAIVIRWLLVPAPAHCRWRLVNRTRAFLLAQRPASPQAGPGISTAMRWFAFALVAAIYFAIVAAHQLTPYMALLGVAALALLGVVWRDWLVTGLLAVTAFGYLAPRYGLISSQFGGVFSGGDVFENAAGSQGIVHKAAELRTGEVVHVLAALMWLGAAAAIALRWRSLGRVAIPAVLAFTPFSVLGVQSYGGEAIYRVFLFSAPWCALLIAELIAELRGALRPLVSAVVCTVALAAGLQGLYGPTAVYAFTPPELAASFWLYGHAPPGSLLILPADDFPGLEAANSAAYDLQIMPSDPQNRAAWLPEASLGDVVQWIESLGHPSAYVVFSKSMGNYASYFGYPTGYEQLAKAVAADSAWQVVYRNADVVIYRVTFA